MTDKEKQAAWNREYFQKNKEKIYARRQLTYESSKEETKEKWAKRACERYAAALAMKGMVVRKKASEEASREKKRERDRIRRANNREAEKERLRKWRLSNPDRVSAHNRSYVEKNRDRLLVKKREYKLALKDGYVAQLLFIPVEKVPNNLLDAKREELMVKRDIRKLKTVFNERKQA